MSATDIVRTIEALTPEMQVRAKLFLKHVSEAGIKLYVTETKRTLERQKWLYAQGRTRPGAIVTWTMQSNHLTGHAMDVCFVDANGKTTYDGDWQKLGSFAPACGLTWGGTWKQPDKPHFELNLNAQTPMDNSQATPVTTPVVPLAEAQAAEQWFIDKQYVQSKKDLEAAVTRSEFYVILQRIIEGITKN